LPLAFLLLFPPPNLLSAAGENTQSFQIKEDIPVGTVIGVIGDSDSGGLLPRPPPPPYLIAPLGDNPDKDLNVNHKTGEIRTKRPLDREKTHTYSLSAIPLNGDSITVVITVLDINDNTPTFPKSEVDVAIPENTPRGTRRKLSPALDADLGRYGTQKYDIISGNDDGTFLLTYDGGGRLELDLVVNGDLDREKTDTYRLKIVALDGGSPPRTGTLTVNIHVQDLNDNPPLFGKQRYFTSVSEDLAPGSSVLKVAANDADDGDNARVTYSINRRQSDKDEMFRIDETTGLLVLDKRLDFDRKQVHEIVVVARDGGEVPQETSAFITVRLTGGGGGGDTSFSSAAGVSDEKSTGVKEIVPKGISTPLGQIRLVYLYNRGKNAVRENLPTGQAFARLELTKASTADINVVEFDLVQRSSPFKLFKNSSGVYLAVAEKLDFERRSLYSVTIDATDPTNAAGSFQESFDIKVEDSNDHAPLFSRNEYQASLEESAEPGTPIVTVKATDEDDGENGRIRYSLKYGEDSAKHSDWFVVDEHSGLISTQTYLDCEAESNPRVIVVAEDHGDPRLSSSVTLSVSVNDVNDNVPLFESAYYVAKLPEDKATGECFLKVRLKVTITFSVFTVHCTALALLTNTAH
jgi:protocadherin-16/23